MILYPRQDTEGTWCGISTSTRFLKAYSPDGAGEHGLHVTAAHQGVERTSEGQRYKLKSPRTGPEINQTLRLAFFYYCFTTL